MPNAFCAMAEERWAERASRFRLVVRRVCYGTGT